MWLKLLGCSLVIISGTAVGFQLAGWCGERVKQLNQLMAGLISLKSLVISVAMPLPEALARCTAGISGPVADMFKDSAVILSNRGWLRPGQALKLAIEEQGENLAFAKPELNVLAVFAANLGNMNRTEQEKHFAMAQEQLAKIERYAARSRDQNSKMYRYLGVCGGMALAILLV